jgi:hypothetical protein
MFTKRLLLSVGLASCLVTASAVMIARAGEPAPASPRVVWSVQFGSDNSDIAWAAARDADGNVAVVGETRGNFEGSCQGERDAIVAVFDAEGEELWRHQFGTEVDDYAEAVAPDADGGWYVGATFNTSTPYSEDNVFDVVLIHFDADGNELWRRDEDGDDFQAFASAVSDADGNAYFCFGMDRADRSATGVTVVSYDADGQERWRSDITNVSTTSPAVAVDSGGNCYVGCTGPADGPERAIVVKLDANGAEVWRAALSDQADHPDSRCEGLDVTPDGSPLLLALGRIVPVGKAPNITWADGVGCTAASFADGKLQAGSPIVPGIGWNSAIDMACGASGEIFVSGMGSGGFVAGFAPGGGCQWLWTGSDDLEPWTIGELTATPAGCLATGAFSAGEDRGSDAFAVILSPGG